MVPRRAVWRNEAFGPRRPGPLGHLVRGDAGIGSWICYKLRMRMGRSYGVSKKTTRFFFFFFFP